MANLVINDVVWKKGEQGTQIFWVKDSDGTTAHDLTGHTYTFKFWLPGASSNKGSASCTISDAATGKLSYTVTSGNTDTVGEYVGEINETDTNLKTKDCKVSVLTSSAA